MLLTSRITSHSSSLHHTLITLHHAIPSFSRHAPIPPSSNSPQYHIAVTYFPLLPDPHSSQGRLAARLLHHPQKLPTRVHPPGVALLTVIIIHATLENDRIVLERDGDQATGAGGGIVAVVAVVKACGGGWGVEVVEEYGVDVVPLVRREVTLVDESSQAGEIVGEGAEAGAEFVVHPAEDDGIVAGVGHGQPVEERPQVYHVGPLVRCLR